MIIRHGLEQLGSVLAELGVTRPFLVASDRWDGLRLPAAARWSEVPSDRVAAAVDQAAGADAVLAVGGGSAIDLAKAISAGTGLPLVSVPTTYSGAEWTTYFGIRDPSRRMKGGGSGANLAAAVYDVELTLDLPRTQSGGTALNALAHCAEALYVRGRNDEADHEALAGARLIAASLPLVLEDGHDAEARSTLLEGAIHAGAALGSAGLGLGHAMAQAVGGRFGIAHGAANALCLPPALRFNAAVAGEQIARFGNAIGAEDSAARVEELARLAGFQRLRDLGVPEDELDEVAEATVVRAGAKANPREAGAAEVAELLRTIW